MSRPPTSAPLMPQLSNRPVLPPRFTLSSSAAAVPPLTPLANPHEYGTRQALYTTYPARMRLGTSSLMQPSAAPSSNQNGNGSNGNQPSSSSRAVSPPLAGIVLGKRTRAPVNYAEMTGFDLTAAGNGRPSLAPSSSSNDLLRASSDGPDPAGAGNLASTTGNNTAATTTSTTNAKAVVWGDGKSYLGTLPPGNLVIVQPAKMTRHGAFSEDQLEDQAEQQAVFVPIQIDLEVDTFRIRDSFVWNINEKLITPESFARIFCDDLDIPPSCASEVARQIKEQCGEQMGVAEIPVRAAEDELAEIEKDLRVILHLNVMVGTLHLVDRIEWDLSSSLTPELFASVLVRDISLPSSASPLIATAIYEELHRLKKDCLQMGLIGDEEGGVPRRRGPRPLEGVWRDWNETKDFGPSVEILTLDEMDKKEAERDRALRRAKRDKMTGARTTGRRR
ncbi:BZ3500_MvSof-1268-A1-R1_Chr2-1g04129 [Microbotryum saponariae]|uniref:BZ3500_MvSof-1268-A1-R1_Chr2-1g04129 protein n=1 Tax=Microbotryum saponariae TaxID=289078 RepID=A0A2X0KBP7_9BASI|nr:BZ3500_MvSof-1268-A1-R1_Chr2-1g04129 [Microbotryum saponariae]SCZ91116.1 BZ3501_MvSof-1269-A2-R1_Chr2-1g03785 [Microbotryum saponariae]